jgi:hypothetical protein
MISLEQAALLRRNISATRLTLSFKSFVNFTKL